jgi:hypothetical protein
LTFRFAEPSVVRRIFDDLTKIEDGKLNIEEIRAHAPKLNNYRLVLGWSHALRGVVHGHPLLADGGDIVTSQLVYLDTSLGLARTASRWYELVEPQQGRER